MLNARLPRNPELLHLTREQLSRRYRRYASFGIRLAESIHARELPKSLQLVALVSGRIDEIATELLRRHPQHPSQRHEG